MRSPPPLSVFLTNKELKACLAGKEKEIKILTLNKGLSFWTFKKNKEAKKIVKKECIPAAEIAQKSISSS